MSAPAVRVAQARVEEELPPARAWADRRGLELDWDLDALGLRLALEGPGTADGETEPYVLAADFTDYKVMPASWRFVHPETEEDIGAAAYPKPGPNHPRTSPLFIDGEHGPVICAPFNRLAFRVEGGPHDNWGDLTNWQNAGTVNEVRATTVAEMLGAIYLDVRHSEGRKAPLP